MITSSQSDTRAPDRQGRRMLSGGAVLTVAGVTALLLFVFQNTEDVRFRFILFTFTWPLWLYTIVVAICGAVVWVGLGVLRRHRRRVARRAARE